MTNRLAAESSPYLQQHAENPVEWYPWGADAFAAARASDRPILLSVGYAACHWCHVMAHESFEDPTTAGVMNALFVNVKVDREERPDVDSIYMQAVQAITGQGGWPMTAFLTPEGVPFFGGTYFPPNDRHGLPSFRRVLESVSSAWQTKRDDVLRGAESLRGIYDAAAAPTTASDAFSAEQWHAAIRSLEKWHDRQEGGFGSAPKFPQPQLLDALLRLWARTKDESIHSMVRRSFGKMARGGLYDQLGGGFHRYAVDAVWLVPHFEKMLYDNALLARLAVHLWQDSGDAEARRIALETFAWVEREMTNSAGGWYASLDADSEGHEGRFYVWSHAEFNGVLGDAAELAAQHWGVSESGTFEGENILHVVVPVDALAAASGRSEDELRAQIELARARLFAARAPRVRPARDDKVLASWNGLMLRAVAEGARAFDDTALHAAALKAGEFLLREMVRDGRALRSWRDGVAKIPGFLEDHAALGLGFIALYQLTFDRKWLDAAVALDESCVQWFWNDAAGAFFDTAHDAEPLVTRPRDVADNAMPSGTSLAVELQLILAAVLGSDSRRRRAEYVIATLAPAMQRAPLAFGHLLGATDLAVNGAVELAIAGDPKSASAAALARAAAEVYAPSLIIVGGVGESVSGIPLMEGRHPEGDDAIAFVCRHRVCKLPTGDAATLKQQLLDARG